MSDRPGALSERTLRLVEQLFAPAHQVAVRELLEHECGLRLPLMGGEPVAELERIRFAVLKVSAGDPTTLARAVELAKVDWRDLLVEAGFAHRVLAHESWYAEFIRPSNIANPEQP